MSVFLDHINGALTRIGENPITSLTQGDHAANVAANNYEKMVEAELSRNRWRFATKFEVLSLIDADVAGDPPEPWAYSYQLPPDIMVLRTVKSGGEPIRYARMKDKVFCDVGSEAAVYAHYAYRVPEVDWPPYFAEALTIRLEAVFLRAIGERYEQAEDREKDAVKAFAVARRLDAQSQTPVNPMRSPTLEARRGTVTTTASTTGA